MCLEAAKSIPTGELLAYKLIARRKEDGLYRSLMFGILIE